MQNEATKVQPNVSKVLVELQKTGALPTNGEAKLACKALAANYLANKRHIQAFLSKGYEASFIAGFEAAAGMYKAAAISNALRGQAKAVEATPADASVPVAAQSLSVPE